MALDDKQKLKILEKIQKSNETIDSLKRAKRDTVASVNDSIKAERVKMDACFQSLSMGFIQEELFGDLK